MNPKVVMAALRAHYWLPVLGVVVGGLASFAFTLGQTPEYVSKTQLFVSTTDAASSSDVFQGSQFSEQRVASYAQLIVGHKLSGRILQKLNLRMSVAELQSKIAATPVPDTVLINVEVTDSSAQRAQRIASAVGAGFTSMITDLERPAGGGGSPVKVAVTDEPEVPSVAASPRVKRDVGLGALVGLLAGASLALLRGRMDRSVKDPGEIPSLVGAPVIGLVLRDDELEAKHVVDRRAGSRTLEDYRQLRTNLQFLNVDEPPKVIMVSSALPSEGKTTMVVNLALALADADRKVTIVEADLRKPKVTRYLGMVGGVGLTNVLTGSADVDDVLQHYGDRGLAVIAAGPVPPNPGELLSSSHMFSLLDKLRGWNDFVLVDAPRSCRWLTRLV